MTHKNICSFFSVLCFTIFLNFIPNIAQAHPSDCVQTAVDGTVNCIKATDNWTGIYGGNFTTFKALQEYSLKIGCTPQSGVICREKDFVGVWDGRSCSGNVECNLVNGPTADNKSGYLYHAYYVNQPGTGYSIGGGSATHQLICPDYHSLVNENYYGEALCKPSTSNYTQSVALFSPNPECDKCARKNPSLYQKLNGATPVGDPVNATNGNQYMSENDYVYNSSHPLIYTRLYNSKTNKWKSNWEYTLSYTANTIGKTVIIYLPNGTSWAYRYNQSTDNWDKLNSGDNNILSFDSGTNEFTYTLESKNKVIFTPQVGTTLSNNIILATKIVNTNNLVYIISYDSNSNLNKITNIYDKELIINQLPISSNCGKGYYVASVVGPDNTQITYTNNSSCNLTKVTYPDNKSKEYIYNGLIITKVKDEEGNILQTNVSNTTGYRSGTVIETTGLGNNSTTNKPVVNNITFNYDIDNTMVKDGLNNSSTIKFKVQNGQSKATSYSTLCTWCDGIQGSSIAYNNNGYMNSITDFKGNVTQLDYDLNKNLLTQIKESTNNTGLQRQTDITYDPIWNLPTTIVEPSGVIVGGSYNNRVTTNTYDQTTGRLTQKSISAPQSHINTSSITRTWNYLYDSQGRLEEVQNPKYVANLGNDKVTYTYNNNGQIQTITDGLNHTTTFNSYNNFGKPTSITLADGNSLSLDYNLRGKVISSTKNGSTTTITRNAAQLVTKVTMPSGSYKNLIYDVTQRLTTIEEYDESNVYQGKIVYTLDNMSNLTSVQVLDSTGNQIRLNTKQYNNKNLLYKDLTALNYATTYTYDANGNLASVTDANNGIVSYTYDSLNRISTQTNPDNGVTTFNYNPDDTIASVIAPTNQTTSYKYNGFGEITAIISPDTGTTTINRNLVGEIISKTDGRGITASYSYDSIGRPTTVTYPNSNENVSITYDTCNNGVGKVCTINDVSGSSAYSYNANGKVESRTIINGSSTKTLQYGYDNFNRLNSLIYPSGMIVNYTYANEKPIAITYNAGGSSGNIITNGVYEPFSSSIKSFQYGNGASYTKNFNKDGQLTSISTSVSGASVNQSFGFDSRLNINSITGSNSTSVTYDSNSRITSYNGVSYNYNQNENRTTAAGANYNYVANSNKLNNVSGSLSDSFGYDNMGNQISSSGKTYSYNNAGSFTGYTDSLNNYSYVVNSLGERLMKVDNNDPLNTTAFVYDNAMLLGEYKNNGSQEYIYLNGMIVAMVKNGVLYNVYNDHLGTPRTVTDQGNNIVWKWDNTEVFGNNAPSVQTVEFNLRFPGQYFDNESNLHYNYYRTYNPKTGKYIQSDPLGLEAGTNTYGYVSGNSLSASDPLGLETQILRLYDPWGVDHLAIRFVNKGKPSVIMSIYSDSNPIPFLYAKASLVIETDKLFNERYNNKNYKLDIITLNTTLEEENIIANEMISLEKNRYYTAIGSGIQCTKAANISLSKIGLPELTLNLFSNPNSLREEIMKNKEYKKRILKNENKIHPYF